WSCPRHDEREDAGDKERRGGGHPARVMIHRLVMEPGRRMTGIDEMLPERIPMLHQVGRAADPLAADPEKVPVEAFPNDIDYRQRPGKGVEVRAGARDPQPDKRGSYAGPERSDDK